MLDSLGDAMHALPSSIIRDIAQAHLSDFAIFNAHLLLNCGKIEQSIRYLPLYEDY